MVIRCHLLDDILCLISRLQAVSQQELVHKIRIIRHTRIIQKFEIILKFTTLPPNVLFPLPGYGCRTWLRNSRLAGNIVRRRQH